jgi:hypothetical protein
MRRIIGVLIVLVVTLSVSVGYAQDETEVNLDDLMKQLGSMNSDSGAVDMGALMGMASMFESVGIEPGSFENTEFGYWFDVPMGWSGTYMFNVLAITKGNINQMMSSGAITVPTIMLMADVPEDEDDDLEDIDFENVDLNEFKKQFVMENENESVDMEVIDIKRLKVDSANAIMVEMKQTIEVEDADRISRTHEAHSYMFMFKHRDVSFNLIYAAPIYIWSENEPFFTNHVKSIKLN